MTREWTPTLEERPPDGTRVEAIVESGHQVELVYRRGLWWTPDESMYVYYVPVFWRAKAE